jgi:hypothetical protein
MKNSFFPIIILFEKAVKEIQHSSKWKFVAKNYVRDIFFCGSKSEKKTSHRDLGYQEIDEC